MGARRKIVGRKAHGPKYPHIRIGGIGELIACRCCGYNGASERVRANILGAGQLERCPVCRRICNEVKMENKKWKVDKWEGCYPSNWKGLIVPDAIAHPAKFSSRLIRRIYDHLVTENWVQEGDTVVDPFGGVCLGAFDAMRVGLRWRGVELEKKFSDLGDANIMHWNVKFRRMPKWSGDAEILNGDSRRLLEVLKRDGNGRAAVSSPPYADADKADGGRQGTRSQILEMGKDPDGLYGSTEGQLGAMKANGFQAALSSPPYADGSQHTGGNDPHPEKMQGGTYFGVGIAGVVSSPPYAEARIGQESRQGQCGRGDQYGGTDGQLGGMEARGFEAAISSPPYTGGVQLEKNSGSIDRVKQYDVYKASGGGQSFEAFCRTQELHSQGYGNSDGQLGVMPSNGFDAAVSSPPFRQSEGGTPEPKPGGVIDERLYARHAAGNSAAEGYGGTEGQLANMQEGDFDVAVSSPPFEKGSEGVLRSDKFKDPEAFAREQMTKGHESSFEAKMRAMQKDNERADYGTTEGQLGNNSGEDFWLAARQIVEQVYLALEPGGHACWVVKDFVKNKARVEFSDQWRQLCEAVGFETVHEHHAMLVHHKGTSITLEGEMVEHKTESKSFFRRLSEKKGSPRIDYETVWCMVKP